MTGLSTPSIPTIRVSPSARAALGRVAWLVATVISVLVLKTLGAASWVAVTQATIEGIKFGLQLAMIGIGLSLVFATTGMVNFAHGELVAFGAIVAWFLASPDHLLGGVPLIVAAGLAVLLTAGFGGVLELGIWRPLRARRTGLIEMLVVSIGLSFVLRNVLQLWFGGRTRPYSDYAIQNSWAVGSIRVAPRAVATIVIAVIVLLAVGYCLKRTTFGKSLRAISDDVDLALSSGLDVRRIVLQVWILAGALAGGSGVLIGLDLGVSHLMGFRVLLLVFAGIVLGGLGSAHGALVGSLVVGLVTELSTLAFSPELRVVWAGGALILVLLLRPTGILGRAGRIG